MDCDTARKLKLAVAIVTLAYTGLSILYTIQEMNGDNHSDMKRRPKIKKNCGSEPSCSCSFTSNEDAFDLDLESLKQKICECQQELERRTCVLKLPAAPPGDKICEMLPSIRCKSSEIEFEKRCALKKICEMFKCQKNKKKCDKKTICTKREDKCHKRESKCNNKKCQRKEKEPEDPCAKLLCCQKKPKCPKPKVCACPPRKKVDHEYQCSEELFKCTFRVSWETFKKLKYLFKNSQEYRNLCNAFCEPEVPVDDYILMFLWFTTRKCSYLELADNFNVPLSKSVSVVDSITHFLNEISKDYIKFPEHEYELEQIASCFSELGSFPGVISCLLCMQVTCTRNANGPYWIQAFVDNTGRFQSVYVDCPGRNTTPTEILIKSHVARQLQCLCKQEYHVLANDCYCSSDWLLTPFDDPVSTQQCFYNDAHKATYSSVEDTLEKLAKRFKQITALGFFSASKVKKMVRACCVAHNICIDAQDFC